MIGAIWGSASCVGRVIGGDWRYVIPGLHVDGNSMTAGRHHGSILPSGPSGRGDDDLAETSKRFVPGLDLAWGSRTHHQFLFSTTRNGQDYRANGIQPLRSSQHQLSVLRSFTLTRSACGRHKVPIHRERVLGPEVHLLFSLPARIMCSVPLFPA